MTLEPCDAVVITRIVNDRCYTRAFANTPGGLRAIVSNGRQDYETTAEHSKRVHEAFAEQVRWFVECLHFFKIDDGMGM